MKSRQKTVVGAVNIDTSEEIIVAWARRQETIRGVLKLFRVIVDTTRRHAEQIQSNLGISAAQFWILAELARSPGLRALDIAKRLAMHSAAAMTTLDGLRQQGLADPSDTEGPPKSRRWTITGLGQARLAATDAPARGSLGAALDLMDDTQIQALAESLRPLVAALGDKDGAAALVPLSDLFSMGNDISRQE